MSAVSGAWSSAQKERRDPSEQSALRTTAFFCDFLPSRGPTEQPQVTQCVVLRRQDNEIAEVHLQPGKIGFIIKNTAKVGLPDERF